MAITIAEQQRDLSATELYNYFMPPPPPASTWRSWMARGVALMAFVFMICIICLQQHAPQAALYVLLWGTLFCGWPIPLALFLRAREHARPVPYQLTDAEYNTWVNRWRTPLLHQGLEKLGLTTSDISGEILYVRGIVWPDASEAYQYRQQGSPVMLKHGIDGLLHASIYRFTFFYPTQHYLAIFSCDVNALHPLHYQTTQTYFYQDIVGIETHERLRNIDSYNYGTQRFEVHLSNGKVLSSVIYAPEAPVERIVLSLRTLLRDKKYGINGGGRGYAGY